MANLYFGDFVSQPSSNWNTVSNWYSTTGYVTGKGSIPGLPAGRLPTTGDVVYICTPSNITISTGPSGGSFDCDIFVGYNSGLVTFSSNTTWNGKLALQPFGNGGNTYNKFKITAGVWNGEINISNLAWYSTNNNAQFHYCSITGGTFNGPMIGSAWRITGGVFNGVFSLNHNTTPASTQHSGSEQYFSVYAAAQQNPYTVSPYSWFVGGTYSPTAIITFSYANGKWTPSSNIVDPGFAAGGGTYSPNITYVFPPTTINGNTILGL